MLAGLAKGPACGQKRLCPGETLDLEDDSSMGRGWDEDDSQVPAPETDEHTKLCPPFPVDEVNEQLTSTTAAANASASQEPTSVKRRHPAREIDTYLDDELSEWSSVDEDDAGNPLGDLDYETDEFELNIKEDSNNDLALAIEHGPVRAHAISTCRRVTSKPWVPRCLALKTATLVDGSSSRI